MKKNLLITIPVFLLINLLSSCVINFEGSITGNGKVVTEKRDVEPFDELDVSSGLEVFILFGEEPSLEVEADENLMDVIRTDFNKGKLLITTDLNIRSARSKKIHLTVPEIHSLEISSAAHVRANNLLKTEEFEIEVSSAGRCEIQVETRSLSVEVSSAGRVSLAGNADEFKAKISSAGYVDAYELVTNYCEADVSSAGHAKLNVLSELDAEASSAGSITYMGDPGEVRVEKSSAGSISKR